jgi:CBS domain containing-hemolysin-like protein
MSASEPRSPDTPFPAADSSADRAREPGDSLIERIMVRLGLKAPPSIRHDLEDALEETATAGEFSPHERAMLKNVLRLRQKRIDDVMVPRADIVAVSEDIALGELLRQFKLAGHSRLPVYGETLDEPRGMVHIRDFLDYMADQADAVAPGGDLASDLPDLRKVDLTTLLADARILRPVLFVPPSMPALDLLLKMQSTRMHMALVIDEYGGTDGLVSIEDLVETVVGDIEDEHDFDEGPTIVVGADGRIIADGRASLEEASAALGLDLAEGELAEDVDTLGGLIATLAGRVPSRGEVIAGPADLDFEVLDADPRRIKRLRIHRRGEGTPNFALQREPSKALAGSDPAGLELPEAPPAPAAEPGSSGAAGRTLDDAPTAIPVGSARDRSAARG